MLIQNWFNISATANYFIIKGINTPLNNLSLRNKFNVYLLKIASWDLQTAFNENLHKIQHLFSHSHLFTQQNCFVLILFSLNHFKRQHIRNEQDYVLRCKLLGILQLHGGQLQFQDCIRNEPLVLRKLPLRIWTPEQGLLQQKPRWQQK